MSTLRQKFVSSKETAVANFVNLSSPLNQSSKPNSLKSTFVGRQEVCRLNLLRELTMKLKNVLQELNHVQNLQVQVTQYAILIMNAVKLIVQSQRYFLLQTRTLIYISLSFKCTTSRSLHIKMKQFIWFIATDRIVCQL